MSRPRAAGAFILANRNADGSPRQEAAWTASILQQRIRSRYPDVSLVAAYTEATRQEQERARRAA